MSAAPIECVANVSEGRRRAVIDAVATAIASSPGTVLLDVSSDAAHHRSVFSFAGTAAALEAAVLALTATALSHIDLRQHRGEHPRIGAVDVIPFVPLGATTMAECVALARSVGANLADRFGLPVFLYEEAASRPGRRRLEDVRREQFEGLAARLASQEWAPDFGPAHPHPSGGAAAVGARNVLVAYNVVLATDRIEIAREVAAAVRERGGGLPAVKALGFYLSDRGCAQVSMNLTDFRRTGIRAAFDRVAAEARRRGVEVRDSELIGLAPAAALDAATAEHIGLVDFSPDRILENRIHRLTDGSRNTTG